ncbi:MAG: hypothetical protein JSS02_14710 [Planctomycetes bacterium]|nr:hypothetical protein [Planctomycetota bacterium]
MSIKITCAQCQKSYQVKDDAAGKKFRCKGCETLIPVPLPVATLDEEPALDDDWSDLIEDVTPEPPPPRRRQPKSRPKPARRAAVQKTPRRPIPATVVATCLLCTLGSVFWFFVGKQAISIVQGPIFNGNNLQHASWPVVAMMGWAGLDVLVLLGLLFRLNAARLIGMLMDGLAMLGTVAMVIVVIMSVVTFASELQPGQYIRWGAVVFRIVIILIIGLIWFIDFKLLGSDDTVEYVME